MRWLQRPLRWLIVFGFLLFLITYPQDYTLGPNQRVHRTQWENLSDLFHRLWTLSPGQTVDGRQIIDMLGSSVVSSLSILGVALLFVLVFGIAKGVYDGLHTYAPRFGSFVSASAQSLAESIPDFFLVFALELFGFFLNRHGLSIYFVGERHNFLTGTVVPAAILALVPMMLMARMVRATVEEQFGQQYIVTAMAKGLKQRRLVWRHIFPNTLNTIVSALLPVFGLLLSNLVIVEYLFYRDGVMSGVLYGMGLIPGQRHPFDAPVLAGYFLVALAIFVIYWLVIRLVLHFLGYRGQVNPYTNTLYTPPKHRIPWQVLVGGGMLVLVLVTGELASHLHLADPDKMDVLHRLQNGDISTPPYPPSAGHWLGSDLRGRDLLSRAVHDALPTFGWVAVTLAVMLTIACLLALLSSVWQIRPIRFLINTWNACVTLVPGVVCALLILEIPDVSMYGFTKLIQQSLVEWDKTPVVGIWSFAHTLIYLAVVCFVETGRLVYQLQAALDEVTTKTYMEAAEISGNSTWSKLLLYYAPPLRMAVAEQAVIGFSRVLLLTSTLGFFSIAIGQSLVPDMTGGGGYLMDATSHDWGSLFAENARDFLGQTYVLFAPALFVTWTVVGLNILLVGIRRLHQLQPRYRGNLKTSIAYRLLAPRDAKPPGNALPS